jgi:uncharacterized protein
MIKHFRNIVYLFAAIGFSAIASTTDDLFTAVGRDDDRTVVSLVNGGLDPNVRRGDGQTALHVALRDESPKVIQALLALPKVDVNALNASGESPLMMAALRGNVPAAEALLARGARVHQDGWSPLHYAATGPEPKLVTLLIARGAQIESLSPNKTTPLMMAARYGDERNVDVLLAARANLKARNDKDLTAADFALLAGREKLAARLKP